MKLEKGNGVEYHIFNGSLKTTFEKKNLKILG
jgi:hypothetical protein